MSRAQLSQLLPLPDDELQQVLDYAATLSKPDAASHFSNLLGDSPLAVDFIASFNARRETPSATHSAANAAASSSNAVPKSKRGGAKKKKAALHTPQARLVDSYVGPSATAYSKKDTDLEYISQRTSAPTSNHASRPATPPLTAAAAAAPKQHQQPAPKQHGSSAGFLISESLSKPKSKSNPSTRSSTPKPVGATKITLAGGTPMAGQASATADLDAAIRALELSTNPSLDSVASRRCPCVATRHPLQTAAPNCLSCGKVICVREGLGPCTFCGAPLLAATEVQALVRALKDERGRERMAAHASTHRRAEISQKPAPFSQPRGNFGTAAVEAGPSLAEASAAQQAARQHRDKLLNFQAQNAQRTTVRDEASDFDVTAARAGTGGNMWASPEERARELKRQQKILREMEWNARPEYEKRQQVMSIDLVNGRVVRKMAPVERPRTPEEDSDTQETILSQNAALTRNSDGGGAFSSNPLLGALMKPVFTPSKGKETATAATAGAADDENGKEAARRRRERRKGWRRVQDDQDDNEGLILDGGIHGHAIGTAGDEPECG